MLKHRSPSENGECLIGDCSGWTHSEEEWLLVDASNSSLSTPRGRNAIRDHLQTAKGMLRAVVAWPAIDWRQSESADDHLDDQTRESFLLMPNNKIVPKVFIISLKP